MGEDWEKARDWLKQKSITRMSAKVTMAILLRVFCQLKPLSEPKPREAADRV